MYYVNDENNSVFTFTKIVMANRHLINKHLFTYNTLHTFVYVLSVKYNYYTQKLSVK